MKKFILITGGARSGKSTRAVELARQLPGKTAFIATAEALDEEMAERIRKHKKSRPENWGLFEESRDIRRILPEVKRGYDAALIDCMGLLVSNLMSDGMKDSDIEEEIGALIREIKNSGMKTIMVSNEAGMGIVPENAAARRFRDLLGSVNRKAAEAADEVIFMVSGLPLLLKGEDTNAEN